MWAFKNERQKCSVVFANDHIIIQVLTCTWDRWQYGRLIAVSHRHEIRACKWLDQNWRKNYKGWGKISFQFFLCVYARSASENHTFSNMPGRIASASQTSSRTSPPPRACSKVSHTLCRSTASWEISRGPGGWLHEPLGDASMCTHVGRQITHSQWCSAFVIMGFFKKKKKIWREGEFCFCRKMMHSVALFASVTNNKGKTNKPASYLS